jgi:hypothetical protein
MKTGIFEEYLGNISTDAFLIIANTNRMAELQVERIRKNYPAGFTITAEFEQPCAETDEEKEEMQRALTNRLRRSKSKFAALMADKKLVRLVLEPKK